MSACDFSSLLAHAGHSIQVVTYGEEYRTTTVAVECADCAEVLFAYDNPDLQTEEADQTRLLAIARIAFDRKEVRGTIGDVLNLSDREIERLRRKVNQSWEALHVASG